MIKVELLVDWLAMTCPHKQSDVMSDLRYAQLLLGYPFEGVATKARHGYTRALRGNHGELVMFGREDMGTHISLSGTALNELRKAGYQPDALINVLSAKGGRASRIDLAIDVRGSTGMTPAMLHDALRRGTAHTASRGYTMLAGSDGGSTLYIGSRQSERFMRIYDKNAEQQIVNSESWMRIELETKGEQAKLMQAALTHGYDLQSIIPSAIRTFCDFPGNPDWVVATDGTHADLGKSSRKETDTQKWLLDVVAKALARVTIENPLFWADFTEAVAYEQEMLEKLQKLSI